MNKGARCPNSQCQSWQKEAYLSLKSDGNHTRLCKRAIPMLLPILVDQFTNMNQTRRDQRLKQIQDIFDEWQNNDSENIIANESIENNKHETVNNNENSNDDPQEFIINQGKQVVQQINNNKPWEEIITTQIMGFSEKYFRSKKESNSESNSKKISNENQTKSPQITDNLMKEYSFAEQLQQLTDLGCNYDKSRKALELTDGDVQQAWNLINDNVV